MNTSPSSLKTQSHYKNLNLYCLLIAIMITGSAATDMYIPSLPHIAEYFNISASSAKWTITIYLLGFIASQLVYGPLSDRYGRKTILLSALSIGLLGSLLCITAYSISMLWLGRFIQGAGVCIGLTRTIAQDTFKGPELTKTVSNLSLAYGIVPIVAPMVGGYLQEYFQWRGIFVFIFTYQLLLTTIIWKSLPETNTDNKSP